MKNAVITILFGLGLSANAQSVIVENEDIVATENADVSNDINHDKRIRELIVRPLAAMQGVINVGLEKSMGDHTSILFDIGAGNNSYRHEQFQASIMIGGRMYLFEHMEGVYVTARHRSRYSLIAEEAVNSIGERIEGYEEGYDSNTNVMIGQKFVLLDLLTIAGEVGIAGQYQRILPTWAITIGWLL
jgi:hypothetical protein